MIRIINVVIDFDTVSPVIGHRLDEVVSADLHLVGVVPISRTGEGYHRCTVDGIRTPKPIEVENEIPSVAQKDV